MEGLVFYLGPWVCILAMIACSVGMLAFGAIGGTVHLLVRAFRR
jgi:hypothetical protein